MVESVCLKKVGTKFDAPVPNASSIDPASTWTVRSDLFRDRSMSWREDRTVKLSTRDYTSLGELLTTRISWIQHHAFQCIRASIC